MTTFKTGFISNKIYPSFCLSFFVCVFERERERESCLLFNCVLLGQIVKHLPCNREALAEVVGNCYLGYIRPSLVSWWVMVTWSWVIHHGGFAIREGTMVARVVVST